MFCLWNSYDHYRFLFSCSSSCIIVKDYCLSLCNSQILFYFDSTVYDFFFLRKKWCLLFVISCEENISSGSLSVCRVMQDVNSPRWHVNVIPLVLFSVRCVKLFMECFCIAHHWQDVWSEGSENRPVRGNERVEHFKWQMLTLSCSLLPISPSFATIPNMEASFFFRMISLFSG